MLTGARAATIGGMSSDGPERTRASHRDPQPDWLRAMAAAGLLLCRPGPDLASRLEVVAKELGRDAG